MHADAKLTIDSYIVKFTCTCGQKIEESIYDLDENYICKKCKKEWSISTDSDIPDFEEIQIEMEDGEDDEGEEE